MIVCVCFCVSVGVCLSVCVCVFVCVCALCIEKPQKVVLKPLTSARRVRRPSLFLEIINATVAFGGQRQRLAASGLTATLTINDQRERESNMGAEADDERKKGRRGVTRLATIK